MSTDGLVAAPGDRRQAGCRPRRGCAPARRIPASSTASVEVRDASSTSCRSSMTTSHGPTRAIAPIQRQHALSCQRRALSAAQRGGLVHSRRRRRRAGRTGRRGQRDGIETGLGQDPRRPGRIVAIGAAARQRLANEVKPGAQGIEHAGGGAGDETARGGVAAGELGPQQVALADTRLAAEDGHPRRAACQPGRRLAALLATADHPVQHRRGRTGRAQERCIDAQSARRFSGAQLGRAIHRAARGTMVEPCSDGPR